MPEIPRPEKVETNALGAPVTAVLVTSEIEPEAVPYNISFARYNEKECQINGMSGSNAQATLKMLRDVGIYFTSYDNFIRNCGSAEIKPVDDAGDYSDLFKGCREEEIKEIKLVKKEKEVDIRMFYFTVEPDRMFYIIATRQTHYDTSKTKPKTTNFRDKRRPTGKRWH